ncbi:MAG: ATP synthase F1 subunit gamma, partial [Anaerovoracaceae bacterium]
YFKFVLESINEIFQNSEEVPEKYLMGNREIKHTCFIIISSCRGLCGGFNSAVIKRAEYEIKNDSEKSMIVAIGSRGAEYFLKRGYDIVEEYCLPPENISFLEVKDMIEPLIEKYEKGEIDEIVMVHTEFHTALDQKVITRRILPIDIEKEINAKLTEEERKALKHSKEIEYEPSVDEVFNYLIPKYAEILLFGAVIESATCEHAARRIAMENATDNARDMISDLTLFYNRARQAAITNEIIEVISGSEAQK